MLKVEEAANSVEAIIGYVFTDKMLCAEAVQMASPQTAVIYNNGIRGVDNNKRLSILGDAILSKELCVAWARALGDHDEPQIPARWTTIRNEILSNDGLAARGYELGLQDYIFVANGTYLKSPKMIATTLEAIIGAVYQDGGDEAVMRVITHLGFLEHRFLTTATMESSA